MEALEWVYDEVCRSCDGMDAYVASREDGGIAILLERPLTRAVIEYPPEYLSGILTRRVVSLQLKAYRRAMEDLEEKRKESYA